MIFYLFHRDLRIYDNLSLYKCISDNPNIEIYPLFIFDPRQIGNNNQYKSNNAIQFMIDSLLDLMNYIPLNIYYGLPHIIIKNIIKDNNYKNNKLYHMYDYTTFARNRHLELNNIIDTIETHDVLLNEDIINPKFDIINYKQFTAFYNKASKLKVNKPIKLNNIKWLKKVKHNKKYSINIKDIKFDYNNKIIRHGGRSNGLKQLKLIPLQYEKTRNILNINSSLLSAYIKFGCLSIREIYHYANKILLGKNKKSFISQLYWNNFGFVLQQKYKVIEHPLKYPVKIWTKSDIYYTLWCNGNTGIPLVDACMRQLNETGYCPNRGRLVVSNVLSKWFRTNWRLGEKYFATKLYDYDPCNNNLGWAFTSGFGVDYQLRIYNPYTHSLKYDPDCLYIKKWIPELKNIPNNDIHNWETTYLKYKNIYIKPIIMSTDGYYKAKQLYN